MITLLKLHNYKETIRYHGRLYALSRYARFQSPSRELIISHQPSNTMEKDGYHDNNNKKIMMLTIIDYNSDAIHDNGTVTMMLFL